MRIATEKHNPIVIAYSDRMQSYEYYKNVTSPLECWIKTWANGQQPKPSDQLEGGREDICQLISAKSYTTDGLRVSVGSQINRAPGGSSNNDHDDLSNK